MSAPGRALPPLRIKADLRERVWGGWRLGQGRQRIGESWGAYEGNLISGGPLHGLQLADACERYGADLLGERVVERFGARFPILTKLLDTSEWLSVQLHPNDEQARELAGPGHVGKTEAWHLLATEPEAEIILGLQPGVDRARFAEAVQAGRTLEVIARQPARKGDTWFIPAGAVHALGPGIFLYEIQQASDITYRVYDWDRPASDERELHLAQAIRCVDPDAGERRLVTEQVTGQPAQLVTCPYFTLDLLVLDPGADATLDTGEATFHALTVVAGSGRLDSDHGSVALELYATVLVPASSGTYNVVSDGGLTLMVATTGNG